MGNEEFEIRPASAFTPQQLDVFMRQFMSAHRADFLRDHGDWKHRDLANRFVVAHHETGEMAGYFAATPTQIFIDNQIISAVWLMDLFVLPTFRGRGLQRLTDAAGRELGNIQVAFPNPLAARIHRKHGWGVREDYRVHMLPLHIRALPHIKRLSGWRGTIARLGAVVLSPLATLYRHWAKRQSITGVEKLDHPDPDKLAAIFKKHNTFVTVHRDADYIRWRFLDSPHREQYRFYGYSDSLALITRTYKRRDGTQITRILDVFGDFNYTKGLVALIKAAVQDAIAAESVYVTALVTHDQWRTDLQKQGFLLRTVSRFRWMSKDKTLMRTIENNPGHWTLADSDNDTID